MQPGLHAPEAQRDMFKVVEPSPTPSVGVPYRNGMGWRIGRFVAALRDRVAALLVALGATPNTLTVGGFLLTCLAAACLVRGAGDAPPWERAAGPPRVSLWPQGAALILLLAFALDMLDGAVARLGKLQSRFGAVLDSTLDRLSDFAIFGACTVHFALAGNVTYLVLSLLALLHAFCISYVKARAECVVESCGVGAWQRGERCGLFLIAAAAGHIPAALWLLATLPALTVVRRCLHVHALANGRQPWKPTGRFERLALWRHPRGSAGYDTLAALAILFVIAGPWLWPTLYGLSRTR